MENGELDDYLETSLLKNGRTFSNVFERIFQKVGMTFEMDARLYAVCRHGHVMILVLFCHKFGREYDEDELGGEVLYLQNDEIDRVFNSAKQESGRRKCHMYTCVM